MRQSRSGRQGVQTQGKHSQTGRPRVELQCRETQRHVSVGGWSTHSGSLAPENQVRRRGAVGRRWRRSCVTSLASDARASRMQHDCALHSHEIPRPTGSQRGLVLFCGGAPCVLQPRARHVAPMLRTDATCNSKLPNKIKKQQGIHHHLAGPWSATDQHARSRKNLHRQQGVGLASTSSRAGIAVADASGTEWACHATRIVGASRPDQHWRSSKGVGDLETRRRRRLRDGTRQSKVEATEEEVTAITQLQVTGATRLGRRSDGVSVSPAPFFVPLLVSPSLFALPSLFLFFFLSSSPSSLFPLLSLLLLSVFLSFLFAFLFSSLQFLFVIIFLSFAHPP